MSLLLDCFLQRIGNKFFILFTNFYFIEFLLYSRDGNYSSQETGRNKYQSRSDGIHPRLCQEADLILLFNVCRVSNPEKVFIKHLLMNSWMDEWHKGRSYLSTSFPFLLQRCLETTRMKKLPKVLRVCLPWAAPGRRAPSPHPDWPTRWEPSPWEGDSESPTLCHGSLDLCFPLSHWSSQTSRGRRTDSSQRGCLKAGKGEPSPL